MTETAPYLQNYTKISDILAGNHEIRLTRKFEIRDILRPFSVPINRVSRGPPVLIIWLNKYFQTLENYLNDKENNIIQTKINFESSHET